MHNDQERYKCTINTGLRNIYGFWKCTILTKKSVNIWEHGDFQINSEKLKYKNVIIKKKVILKIAFYKRCSVYSGAIELEG